MLKIVLADLNVPKRGNDGTLKIEYMNDGQELDMVYGGKVKITKKDDKTFVNGSEIVASIPTGNGIIHVIGDVLLPK